MKICRSPENNDKKLLLRDFWFICKRASMSKDIKVIKTQFRRIELMIFYEPIIQNEVVN